MFQPLLEAGLRQTMQRLVRPMLSNAVPLKLQRQLIRQVYRTSVPPRSARFSQDDLGNVPVLRTVATPEPSGTILYLHGGGFILGSASTHRGITGHLAKLSGCEVITPEYRLAPEHPFPAGLDDAESVYLALINQGLAAGCIALAGDSAGGGLALALSMRLRDHQQPLPSSITCLSPWTDLSQTHLYQPECEPVLHASWTAKAAKQYAAGAPLTDPLISPLYGDLSALPPLLIQVGSQEILLNDATRLADIAKRDCVETQLEIYNNLWHVFQVHTGQLARATQAMTVVANHVRRHLAD
ncbi:alpha/beta hydrolase [Marinobacter halophilus]|uniref:Alpha/beta hydrolase n=1 Tax=Marinobacter halophilus TaxID=1323740 RepID=A0A2T1KDV8_9GAMM|nr:alpha/beta hydrolase [Marinobacter halophilus]PSF07943.1 alpha/beta hydrolase [Marinobacter halophilus]GGC58430.1 acetylesterase [Marinobacter halophilus]